MTDGALRLGLQPSNAGGFCGEWVGSGPVLESSSPIDGQIIGSVKQVTRVELDLVHTDAVIPPENSGGPLITDDGELVGISLTGWGPAESPGADGASAAIPSVAAIQDFPQIPRAPGDAPPQTP